MDKKTKKSHSSRKILDGIGIPLVLLGFLGFVLHIYQKVSSGHELDTYLTGWGVEMNYIGVLIVLVLIPIVLGGGWVINFFIERRARQHFSPKKNNDQQKLR